MVANRSVEDGLKSIIAAGKVPSNFEVRYDDMHALWGGTTITVRGNGIGERRERLRGQTGARVIETRISQGQLVAFIRLLVALRAWEQRTPDRQAVPDESRATLVINIDGRTSRMWEWFNEMSQNARLSRIRDSMVMLTTP